MQHAVASLETMETREEQPRPRAAGRHPDPPTKGGKGGAAAAATGLENAVGTRPGPTALVSSSAARAGCGSASLRGERQEAWGRCSSQTLEATGRDSAGVCASDTHELDARLHHSQTLQTDVFDALAVIKRMSPKRRISSETSCSLFSS